jgi:hypothetical protein
MIRVVKSSDASVEAIIKKEYSEEAIYEERVRNILNEYPVDRINKIENNKLNYT